jgi:hypothetical protein
LISAADISVVADPAAKNKLISSTVYSAVSHSITT